jgi:large subunit ribosomal protein L10
MRPSGTVGERRRTVLRSEKEEKVAALQSSLAEAEMVVVTHQTGLTVAQSTDLRRQALQAGAGFRVTKNRLARIAVKGTPFEHLSDMFTGPTAIAYSTDPVAAAKVVVDYAKKNDKLEILGGALGEKPLDKAGVEALAKLPSLDELRAKIVGMINTPATRVAGVVQAPAGQLARVFGAYGASGEAA